MYTAAWPRDEESGAAITTSRLAVWINGNCLAIDRPGIACVDSWEEEMRLRTMAC